MGGKHLHLGASQSCVPHHTLNLSMDSRVLLSIIIEVILKNALQTTTKEKTNWKSSRDS